MFSASSHEIIPVIKRNNNQHPHSRKNIMPLLLVAYDPDNIEQDHSKLLDRIEIYSHVRLTRHSYAIITDKTPETVCGELNKYLEKNDNVYVITLKRPYDGCKPSLTNDWLYKELTY